MVFEAKFFPVLFMQIQRDKIRFIILDRDGVINADSDHYIRELSQWQALPGSLHAMERFTRSGLPIAIASNQSGLGRGYFDLNTLNNMHGRLIELLANLGARVHSIAFCPHRPEDGCLCRKPKTGLLDAILGMHNWEASHGLIVGDSLRDLEAGAALGMQQALVRTGKGRREWDRYADRLDIDCVFDDLQNLADYICR